MNLFQQYKKYENEYSSSHKVSMEMIDEQLNDYIIKSLSNQFLDLINSGCKSNDDFFSNSNTKATINNIDNFIYERFGIRVKHIKSKGIPYACYPVAPNHTNVLNREIETQSRIMEQQLRNYESTFGKIDESKVAKDAYEDIHIIYKRLLTNRKALTEYLKSDSIYIDLRKAKVSNLPSDYLVYILADFHMLINIYKLNEFEMIAVLLHEMGHVFTHLEYSYRVANTTQVLVDTVKDVVMKQNNSTKENLRLVYERATKTKVSPEFEKMNNMTAAIYVGKGIINRTISAQDHSYTDSEQLADQFASKFGMGGYLVTALDKLHGLDTPLTFMKSLWYVTQGEVYTFVVIGVILGCFTMGARLPFIPLALALHATMLAWITLFRKSNASEETLSVGMTYDDIKRRFARNKNELVRQLALAKLPKELETEIVNGIKTIEKSMAKVPDAHNGIIDKFFLLVSDDKKFIVNSKRTEQVLEDIISNDVHIGRALVKDLI